MHKHAQVAEGTERMERSREDQVREDAQVRRADLARRYEMSDAVLSEYGAYVASLAPWRWFVTLTHDAKRLRWDEAWDLRGRRVVIDTGITQVRAQRHRKQVREWFYDDVKPRDRGAQWWSEMEQHESGQAHEHGLLSIRDSAAMLSIRQAWFERCGYAVVRPMTSVEGAAVYVAKYTGKSAASAPCIYGLYNVGAATQLRERWWLQRAVAGEAACDPLPRLTAGPPRL
jgi:hypothetical protein